ncbi:Disease resistance protein [Heracleum sosnowskyi]|uniref:Disease resistance protein n=1 Tax=Heracleum sosnowskyi TaxID=360622 RepID=A0AAD8GPY2_9APIA|nr:Disease resistance protein [Heracleum sosnowskyi]
MKLLNKTGEMPSLESLDDKSIRTLYVELADAIVSFAVERLGDLLISETKLLYGVSDQINEIRRELKRMQNFLKEGDKKQIQDERVRVRVVEIKELAFRTTEDAIEIFALQGATNSGFKEASSQLISRHKVVTEMNDIKAKLANIHQSLTTYGITKGLEEGETSNSQVNFKTRRISLPYDVEKDFIGMEKEIEELVSSLKKEDAGSSTGLVVQGTGLVASCIMHDFLVQESRQSPESHTVIAFFGSSSLVYASTSLIIRS